MADTTLTWLGHAAFRLDTAGGKRVYIDPFLTGNPKCPPSEQAPERVDIIAVTHGHGDHVGDTVDLAQKHDATVVALVELAGWLGKQGVDEDKLQAPNKGGTVDVDGIKFTLTNAFHSSSSNEGEYLGEATGIVVELENGKKIYFAGDTCVFGDMQLIRHLWEPDYAVLPIGDYFTMGPREAAIAIDMLGNPFVVPCHWGTFPVLRGTPDELQEEKSDAKIVRMEPGETIELE